MNRIHIARTHNLSAIVIDWIRCTVVLVAEGKSPSAKQPAETDCRPEGEHRTGDSGQTAWLLRRRLTELSKATLASTDSTEIAYRQND